MNNNLTFQNLKKDSNLPVLKRIEKLRTLGFYDLDLNKRIELLENLAWFDVDVNNDLPTKTLLPTDKDLDYLKEKEDKKEKYEQINKWAIDFYNSREINPKINGIKNINILRKSGAIVTVNHFNPLDTFIVENIIYKANINKNIYKVIREGNFTNFEPGEIADYFKYGKTLPLSQNEETMEMFNEALKTILERKDIIIVCPEQSMWPNYEKPRPMKFGAYKWAVKNKVPIVPTFIAPKNNEFQVVIGTPINPGDIISMRNQNFEFAKKTYEEIYNKKLSYKIKSNNLHNYIKTIPNIDKLLSKKID